MGESDSSLTPEQQLLKLIEESQGKEEAGKKGGAASSTEAGKPRSGTQTGPVKSSFLDMIFGRLGVFGGSSDFVGQFTAYAKHQKENISLTQVNRFLRVGVVCLGLYLAAGLFFNYRQLNQDFDKFLSVEQKTRGDIDVSRIRTFGMDLFTSAEKKNVFIPPELRTEKKEDSANPASLKLVEMSQNLKLAGISLSPGDPTRTYCMIEDLQKNMTNVLRVGDTVLGMKIGAIDSDKVVLELGEEQIALT